MSKLKVVRRAIALLFFIVLMLAFIDFTGLISHWIFEPFLSLQFIPSILKFLVMGGMVALGFVIILLITILFGRFYCSAICPLGIMQDIISRIARKFRKRKINRYSQPYTLTRYIILGIVVLSLFTGSIFLLNLLDPYSLFGKIWSGIFRPIVIFTNDSISGLLEYFSIYVLFPHGVKNANLALVAFASAMLLFIILLASFRGRLYCNLICPVGTFLGLISKFSIFKIKIDKTSCNRCGKCSTVCKSECIDVKNQEVDFTRCVSCYNCIGVCPEKGIKYYKPSKAITSQNTDSGKREFVTSVVMLSAVSALGFKPTDTRDEREAGKVKIKKKNPVTPPGAYSTGNFTSHCTACQLCVSSCPTQVLQPSTNEYGLSGFMLPHMNYNKSFCNYECTVCSEVCPNGAIIPINKKEKKTTQIGSVVFVKENCVVYIDETACGACSEHCPTKAVFMVPYKGNITIPETDLSICIGCGGCEYACPAKPDKAIYVEGNLTHRYAMIPKDNKPQEAAPTDFPF